MQRAFLWTMIFSLALAAVLAIMAVLVDGLGDIGTRVLISSLVVGGFSVVCLACAFVLGHRKAVPIMWIGMGSSIGAMAIWLFTVWADAWYWSGPWDEIIIKSATTLTVACIWSAHVGLLLLPPINKRRWQQVRIATVTCATLLGAMVILVFWFELDAEGMFKAMSIVSILTACGTIVTPILALIERLRHRPSAAEGSSLDRVIQVAVRCPRCQLEQTMKAGKASCERCGLRIELRVEEPRCHCGYLLYDLPGDLCPECGRAIADDDRWVRPAGSEAAPESHDII